ncbi:hypothetical protein L1049_011547 [Liquidambar formosana]|uniref:Uncharacterized protein n=1 Tax=Liquidambar formosana TaxID=63359 RepID=A0AAP0RX97_LIQFO
MAFPVDEDIHTPEAESPEEKPPEELSPEVESLKLSRNLHHTQAFSRLHNRPTISLTLLLSNMYQQLDLITLGVDAQGQPIDPRKI